MRALKTTLRLPLAKGRIERMSLSPALRALGLPMNHFKSTSIKGLIVLKHLDEWQLHDLFKAAKKIYIGLIRKLRPDLNRNHDLSARLNALWTRIEFLFHRKGVQIC